MKTCDLCIRGSSRQCQNCATELLRRAECQFDGALSGSPTERHERNRQLRFDRSPVSLTKLSPSARVFFPA
ncbi:MAG: hypothetical protein UU82_C0002G0020 [Candidatus Nomurabacteria bacterium GW2011_GWC2_41_8]|uniref:Uncharacterized protein n=2 Tax=Candidatus Nomuraibacteriota TaxID=1752729 RepID=A0A0G0XIE5_9BACT|nr:MAG: hypothetical protein UU58_C0002G0024 [Candidatus Nomurabacteria bacterium GW2011_GWA2_41_25]KKS24655.1 MAG: hypothetical protein UU82_C0002G0020 [Candidatus Nomurabacteria bacterium GW2011_GWC2_41_8]